MNRSVLTRAAVAGIAVATLALAGCSSTDERTNPTATELVNGYASLTGSFDASGARSRTPTTKPPSTHSPRSRPTWTITVPLGGSGTGKKEFGSNLTDFAGSDSRSRRATARRRTSWYYIPTVAGSITVSYNLSGVTDLQLSPADFGQDLPGPDQEVERRPRSRPTTPASTLPARAIVVVHRSDGSGTTNNFTKYLVAAGGSDWTLGTGDTVDWPADTQAGDKNTGVAQLIKARRRRHRLRRLLPTPRPRAWSSPRSRTRTASSSRRPSRARPRRWPGRRSRTT